MSLLMKPRYDDMVPTPAALTPDSRYLSVLNTVQTPGKVWRHAWGPTMHPLHVSLSLTYGV